MVGLCHASAVVVMGKGGMWGGHGVLNMEVKPASVSRASVASLLHAHCWGYPFQTGWMCQTCRLATDL